MLHYTSLQAVREYRDSPSINQSFLKQKVLKNDLRPFTESLASIHGNLIDAFLTYSPDENLEDLFYIGTFERKMNDIYKVLNNLYDSGYKGELEFYKDKILASLNEIGYGGSTYTEETKWKKVLAQSEYWKGLKESDGKLLVSEEEVSFSKDIVNLIKSHPIKIFFEDQGDIDKYYQKVIYFNYCGLKCKALLDVLIVNHTRKTITIVDIKTTKCTERSTWAWQAKENGLLFQMAWYKEAVKESIIDSHFSDYTIEHKWLVIPTAGKFKPYILPISDELVKIGLEGYKTSKVVNGKTIEICEPGVNDAIEILNIATEKQLIDYDVDYKVSFSQDFTNQLFFEVL